MDNGQPTSVGPTKHVRGLEKMVTELQTVGGEFEAKVGLPEGAAIEAPVWGDGREHKVCGSGSLR